MDVLWLFIRAGDVHLGVLLQVSSSPASAVSDSLDAVSYGIFQGTF